MSRAGHAQLNRSPGSHAKHKLVHAVGRFLYSPSSVERWFDCWVRVGWRKIPITLIDPGPDILNECPPVLYSYPSGLRVK